MTRTSRALFALTALAYLAVTAWAQTWPRAECTSLWRVPPSASTTVQCTHPPFARPWRGS
jgi:hypothetical protein